jgi:hypothetical protein
MLLDVNKSTVVGLMLFNKIKIVMLFNVMKTM